MKVEAAMTITERRVGAVTILELDGRLVLGEGDAVFRARVTELAAQGRVNVVVDLRNVTYIDSSGVGVLAEKYLSLRRKGGDLKLLHLSPRSHRIMEISGLLSIFASFDSEHDAVSSFPTEHPRADDQR
jgi:anti-sigma B factor antagonist